MPRIRSLYIAEMRERFEVVDRKKASPEEKASLTGALQEDARTSSPEVSPSKDNTLRKDDEDKAKLRLSFVDDDEKGDLKKAEDGSEAAEAKNEEGEDEDDINEEDIEAGSHKVKPHSRNLSLVS